jgi:ribosome-interacting GTPase 1
MRFEDVQIQLVDLPPITRQYLPSGLLGLVKATDAALLVGDLGSDKVLEELDEVLEVLEEGRTRLFDPAFPPPDRESLIAYVPTLLVLNKADLPGAEETCDLIRELFAGRFEPIALSCRQGIGLAELPRRLFRLLECVRVYSKEPGKPVDRSAPFVLKRGDTILDLARVIHRDFPGNLRQARVWGSARFEGQVVQKDHQLADGDVVELHISI